MIPRVRIAFDLSLAGAGNFLTLNDPLKGVLDGTTYRLAGEVYEDVSADVRSVSVRRGRSRELTAFTAGQATVVLDNRARLYDPTNMPTVAARTNLVTNPSFEVNTAGWSAVTGNCTIARITTDAQFGAACLQLSFNSSSVSGDGTGVNNIPVTAGLQYAYSVYLKVDTGSTYNYDIVVAWMNSGGSDISYTATGATIVAGTGWVRVSALGTAPVGAVTARIVVRRLTGVGTASVLKVDAVVFEQSATLNPYFDGTSKDGSIQTITQAWNGTPNASTSRITYYVTGTGSPYAPSILPRKAIAIEVGGESVFTGVVEDWDLEYNLNRDATTTAKCTDALTLLADPTLTASTSTIQGSGSRVNTVLDDIDWSAAKRRIATGVTTLGADVIPVNTNALAYLQSIDLGEGGALFVAKDGSVEFLERTDSQLPPTVIFTDDGTGVPFTNIEIDFGTESLFTQVLVDYVGGSLTATAPASSITAYGVVEFTAKTLLANVSEATNFAEFYLFRYSTPQFRINGLQVAMNGLSPANQALILGLELGDPVRVVFTPQGIGDPIEQALVVDQIEHSLSPSDHQVKFNFSQTLTGFILDLDRLDEARLGF